MKIIWTHEALVQLEQIKNFIANDSPNRAAQFIQKIINQTNKISRNPRLGRIVSEISNPDIRELLFKNYRLVYRISGNHIEILTVFEGHRLLRTHEIDN